MTRWIDTILIQLDAQPPRWKRAALRLLKRALETRVPRYPV